MQTRLILRFSRPWAIWAGVTVLAAISVYAAGVAMGGNAAFSGNRIIARGAGKTLIQGGTGSGSVGSYPPFTPVITTLAFHAERQGGQVIGSIDCLALAPESTAGVFSSQSAQFTVNVMYVAGQVTGAVVANGTATLTGTANVTGIGAATNVPFSFVVQRGGPGATAALTVSGLTFHEVLLDGGSFQVFSDDDAN